jgi:hypothetical protein
MARVRRILDGWGISTAQSFIPYTILGLQDTEQICPSYIENNYHRLVAFCAAPVLEECGTSVDLVWTNPFWLTSLTVESNVCNTHVIDLYSDVPVNSGKCDGFSHVVSNKSTMRVSRKLGLATSVYKTRYLDNPCYR